LLKLGERLYGDASLSTNEMACISCHTDFSGFSQTFEKPYPHSVQMAKDVSGIEQIPAEGMVQFCLIRPMMSKPLPWDSEQLAALTAYVEELQKTYAKR
jgi:cytochrome c